jgi:hypothetical protein
MAPIAGRQWGYGKPHLKTLTGSPERGRTDGAYRKHLITVWQRPTMVCAPTTRGGLMSKPKRVALYARVSTDAQTTENQLMQLHAVPDRPRTWPTGSRSLCDLERPVLPGPKMVAAATLAVYREATRRECLSWMTRAKALWGASRRCCFGCVDTYSGSDL